MTSNEKRFFAVGLLVGLAVTCAAFLLLYRSPASPTTAVADTSISNNASSTPADSETTLELSSDDQARIGVRTITVRRETLHGEVMAPGWVEEMDTAVHAINSPFAGRIDRLLVNQPGETIRKGQAIALIDGPDVTARIGISSATDLSRVSHKKAFCRAQDRSLPNAERL
jgi:multidrug efflux pump subunit AcrA (membrane-fusion protein)